MENPIIEGENSIELINNEFCFHGLYHGSDGGSIIKNPKFQKWLKEQIRKKGKGGELYLCDKCNIYCYLKYGTKFEDNERHSIFNYVCMYCGHVFFGGSYCCAKNGLKCSFRDYLFQGSYAFTAEHILKVIPYIFNLIFVKKSIYGFYI